MEASEPFSPSIKRFLDDKGSTSFNFSRMFLFGWKFNDAPFLGVNYRKGVGLRGFLWLDEVGGWCKVDGSN